MIIACDLDGILTIDDKVNFKNYFDLTGKELTMIYACKKPNLEAIKKLRELYVVENTIYIFTCRDVNYFKVTKDWLDTYNVPYDLLIMNKPYYDVIIDDKARNKL